MKKKKSLRKRVAIQINRPSKEGPDYAHIFDEAAIFFQEYILAIKELAIKEWDLSQARKIGNFLQTVSIQTAWIRSFKELEFYRIVPAGRNPISCLGSFSSGGRVNLGTPQLTKEFDGRFTASFGLYGSLELETAKEEYDSSGLPSLSSHCYRITNNSQTVRLFDFDLVTESVGNHFQDFPLASVVSEIPYDAAWRYQKSPKVSQIIGAWLRNHSETHGIDGIVFGSTKKKGGTNLFLFFKDDIGDSASKLLANKIA